MIRTSIATVALAALAAACSDDAPGADAPPAGNPPRLWLRAVEIEGTIDLVATEPAPY